MIQRSIRIVFVLLAVVIVFATIGFAQPASSSAAPATTSINNWQFAQSIGHSQHKVVVVTLDQPNRRQTCRVKSFTEDKLVCSHIGGARTYMPQQVLALILPGDGNLTLKMFLGFNAGLAASIWATVVLTATCPACAAATAFAALVCFSFAGAVAYTDDQPDRLFYLAAAQQLTGKLSMVQAL